MGKVSEMAVGDNAERRRSVTHVFLGVSLANRAFGRSFCERFAEWVNRGAIGYVKIVLFDEIEAINYEVFRGMPHDVALTRARKRGSDLQGMFASRLGQHSIRYSVELESESPVRLSKEFGEIHEQLLLSYQYDALFRRDVQDQVRSNLKARIERHGKAKIEKSMRRLAGYILRELAFLEVYAARVPEMVEVYPGSNMLVKEGLRQGQYEQLQHMGKREGSRRFLDISLLRSRSAP